MYSDRKARLFQTAERFNLTAMTVLRIKTHLLNHIKIQYVGDLNNCVAKIASMRDMSLEPTFSRSEIPDSFPWRVAILPILPILPVFLAALSKRS